MNANDKPYEAGYGDTERQMQLMGVGSEEHLGGADDEVNRVYGDQADSEDIQEALWQQEQQRKAQNK